MAKCLILYFKNPQNWFHVKSNWYKNHEISTLWNHYSWLTCNALVSLQKRGVIHHVNRTEPLVCSTIMYMLLITVEVVGQYLTIHFHVICNWMRTYFRTFSFHSRSLFSWIHLLCWYSFQTWYVFRCENSSGIET